MVLPRGMDNMLQAYSSATVSVSPITHCVNDTTFTNCYSAADLLKGK